LVSACPLIAGIRAFYFVSKSEPWMAARRAMVC
jgi:hypothetical protein